MFIFVGVYISCLYIFTYYYIIILFILYYTLFWKGMQLGSASGQAGTQEGLFIVNLLPKIDSHVFKSFSSTTYSSIKILQTQIKVRI